MTEQEIKDALLQFIKDKLNNQFPDGVPDQVILARDMMYDNYVKRDDSVSSKSIQEIQVVYMKAFMTPSIQMLLRVYQKAKW